MLTGRRVVTWRDTHVLQALHATGQNPDDLKSAILKYIPAEVVTAFVAVDAAFRAASAVPDGLPWLVFGILWLLTPIYVWRATTEAGKPPAKAQIIVSTISFFVWVVTLGGPFSTLPGYTPLYGAVTLPIWTVIPPIILQGSSPK